MPNLRKGIGVFGLVLLLVALSGLVLAVEGAGNSQTNSIISGGKTASERTGSLDYEGYLVEFQDKPLAVYRAEVERVALENQKYIGESIVVNPKKIYLQVFGVEARDIESKTAQYKVNLEKRHARVKNAVLSQVRNNKVIMDFETLFNGVYLNISDSEAKKLEKIPGVKKVSPNYRVYADLMDSVPLIQEGIAAGKLDEDGNDCTVSGKTCLDGSGVKIAVIDTGVDYTHPDLGGNSSQLYENAEIVLKDTFSGDILTLKNGQDVRINGEVIGGLKTYFPVGAPHYDQLEIEWRADRKLFITEENNVSLPGLERLKFVFGGLVEDPSGDYGKLFIYGKYSAGRVDNEEYTLLERVSDRLNLGEGIWDIGVRWLDEDYLINTLKEGVHVDNLGGVLDYDQNIGVGNLTLNYFSDPEYKGGERTLGLVAQPGDSVINYTLRFLLYYGVSPPWRRMNSTSIELLGRNYSVLKASGFDANFNSKVVGGWDFVNNDADPMDDHGHGTHCAATAAGNGTLKGVAPGAKIYAYKVLDQYGSGYSSDVLAGVEMAVDPNMDGDFSDRVDVISMSLGGYGNPDDSLSRAVDNAVGVGTVAAIAAGNSGPWEGSIGSPGTARKAITVAASDKSDVIADFSSRGPVIWINGGGVINTLMKPDVSAPGVSICAAQASNKPWNSLLCFDDKHVAISGTSMATPHVAGAAAILRQRNPNWTPEEIKALLRSSAVDLGVEQIMQGYGRISLPDSFAYQGVPPLAKIETNGGVSGSIDIYGSAGGIDFIGYSLYYRSASDRGNWRLIAQSNISVYDSILYSGFDSYVMPDGDNYLKLVVWNAQGSYAEDISLVSSDNIIINNPLNNDIYRLGDKIIIEGNIMGDYQSVSVEHGSDEKGWISNGVEIVDSGGVIARINSSFMASGTLLNNIRIRVQYPSFLSSEYIFGIYLDSSLRAGWPQKINWFYQCENRGGSSNSYYLTSADRKTVFMKLFNTPGQYTISGPEKEMIEVSHNQLMNYRNKYSVSSAQEMSTFCYHYWAGFIEPVVEDINNDNRKEVIVHSGGNPTQISIFNLDGMLLTSFNTTFDLPGGNLRRLLVLDFDNDGQKEIIPGVYSDYPINVYNPLGELKYSFEKSFFVEGFGEQNIIPHGEYSSSDINDDGRKDLLITYEGENFGIYLDALYYNPSSGKIESVSGWPVQISSQECTNLSYYSIDSTSPSVGDLDKDGNKELVLLAEQLEYVGEGRGHSGGECLRKVTLFALNKSGEILAGFPASLERGEIISGPPVIGDVNKDGFREIVFGTWNNPYPDFFGLGKIYAVDYLANNLSGWPKPLGNFGTYSTPSLSDLNDDGYLEIAAAQGASAFWSYVFDYQGNVLPGWPVSMPWNSYRTSLVGDVNGDNKKEVLTTSGGIFSCLNGNCGGVLAWDSAGQAINGFPKVTEVDAQYSATIGDFDRDNRLDLAASSDWDLDMYLNRGKNRGSVYVWDLGVSYNSSTMDWPMFQHDTQYTGCYDCGKLQCIPNCTGKTCGSNGCGGTCGTCANGTTCNSTGQCVAITCRSMGDVNSDCVINAVDLQIVQRNFGKTTSVGDVNGDGVVNAIDLQIVTSNFGKTCGSCGACSDSDGGLNYTVRGTARGIEWGTGNSVNRTDYCEVSGSKAGFLIEYYCNQNQVSSLSYNCTLGCSQGACVTSATCRSMGDLNNDCVINAVDLQIVIRDFGKSGAGLAGDVNNDGAVNAIDLQIVQSNFGKTCSGCSGGGGCSSKTCAQLNKTCGNWNNGCNGTLNCGNCSSGQTCNSSGQCVSSGGGGGGVPACTDSDNGMNYALKGTVRNSQGNWSDFCVSNTLYELVCDKAGQKVQVAYNCPSGQACSNGACRLSSGTTGSTILGRVILDVKKLFMD